MNNEIPEQNFSVEALNKKMGGNYALRFNPSDFIQNGIKSRVYEVKSCNGVYKWTNPTTQKTSERFEWTMTDPKGEEYILSSWSFITKDVFTPLDLVGKTIVLQAKDEKRAILKIQQD